MYFPWDKLTRAARSIANAADGIAHDLRIHTLSNATQLEPETRRELMALVEAMADVVQAGNKILRKLESLKKRIAEHEAKQKPPSGFRVDRWTTAKSQPAKR